VPRRSIGTHMRDIHRGDRIFVCRCDGEELFLLGALEVNRIGVERSGEWRGKPFAAGKALAGPFQMLPLGNLKWQLRFESTASPRLAKTKSLLWQVRSRRRLMLASAALLLQALGRNRPMQSKIRQQFDVEGRRMLQSVSKAERDPRLRRAVLMEYDYTCVICGLKPAELYGPFAKECLDVHHLRPLGNTRSRRAPTTLRDAILVCPTCHRALHLSDQPGAWQRFKHECGL
jgi:hypothetical protein